jgi:hypothetical protein
MSEDLLTAGSEATLADPTSGCRRHAAMKPLLAAASWLAAAVGSLLVAALLLDSEEFVCGISVRRVRWRGNCMRCISVP